MKTRPVRFYLAFLLIALSAASLMSVSGGASTASANGDSIQILFDKSVYRPGGIVHITGRLVLSSCNWTYTGTAEGGQGLTVYATLYDPDGRALGQVKTDPAAAPYMQFAYDFQLQQRAIDGKYVVTAEMPHPCGFEFVHGTANFSVAAMYAVLHLWSESIDGETGIGSLFLGDTGYGPGDTITLNATSTCHCRYLINAAATSDFVPDHWVLSGGASLAGTPAPARPYSAAILISISGEGYVKAVYRRSATCGRCTPSQVAGRTLVWVSITGAEEPTYDDLIIFGSGVTGIAATDAGLYTIGIVNEHGQLMKRNITDGSLIWKQEVYARGISVSDAIYLITNGGVEKRSLTDGKLVWNASFQIPAPYSAVYSSIVANSNGVFVAGTLTAFPDNRTWLVERFDPYSGSSVWTANSTLESDTAVVRLTASSSALYAIGYQSKAFPGNSSEPESFRWRIEKRSMQNGRLQWATSAAATLDTFPYTAAADESGVYVAGWMRTANSSVWRIEKRAAQDGAIVWQSPHKGESDLVVGTPNGIAVSSLGVFTVGFEGQPATGAWRIEQRSADDGRLVWNMTWPRLDAIRSHAIAVALAGDIMYVGGFEAHILPANWKWYSEVRIEKWQMTGVESGEVVFNCKTANGEVSGCPLTIQGGTLSNTLTLPTVVALQKGAYTLYSFQPIACYPPQPCYVFHHWETTGDINVSDYYANPTHMFVTGSGTVTIVFVEIATHTTSRSSNQSIAPTVTTISMPITEDVIVILAATVVIIVAVAFMRKHAKPAG